MVDFSSLSSVTKELRRIGVDTRTPGLRGEKRKAVLIQRLFEFRQNELLFSTKREQDRKRSTETQEKRYGQDSEKEKPPPPKEPPPQAQRTYSLSSFATKHIPLPRKVSTTSLENTQSEELMEGKARTSLKEPEFGMMKTPELLMGDMKREDNPKPFACEVCGMKFKKVAHVVVHARTHGNLGRSKSPERRSHEDTEKEWVHSLLDLKNPEPPPPKLARSTTMPPPPKHPPPLELLQRSNSMPTRKRNDILRPLFPRPETVESVRADIAGMERRLREKLRERLNARKSIELQEAEWKHERIRSELTRAKETPGLFIDSRVLSTSGRVQRWPREELIGRLLEEERAAKLKVRGLIAAITAEEEGNPEYGKVAQTKLKARLMMLQRESPPPLARNDSDQHLLDRRDGGTKADRVGHEALVYHVVKRQPERAENLYLEAIELDGTHATNLGNYALFLQHWKRDENKAEEFYRKAISEDPNHANNLANFASFLKNVRKDMDRAEQYYERSIRAEPNHAANLGNYATFLFRVRGDVKRADEIFRRAIELQPSHTNNLCNYASLLKSGFQKYEKARELYEKALQHERNNPNILSNYANMLKKQCNTKSLKDPDTIAMLKQAREMYVRALHLDPSHVNAKRNYAIFLRDFPIMRNGKVEPSSIILPLETLVE